MQCRIIEVENARESVDAKGHIQGIRSTATLSNRASGVIGSLAFGDPIAAIFTTAASASVLRFSEPEISLPVGTELIAELTAPSNSPRWEPILVPPIATTPDEKKALSELVEDLPFRTYTDKSHIPSDITNLIFIGSAGAVERAFAASDWVRWLLPYRGVDLRHDTLCCRKPGLQERSHVDAAPRRASSRIRVRKDAEYFFQTSSSAHLGELAELGRPDRLDVLINP